MNSYQSLHNQYLKMQMLDHSQKVKNLQAKIFKCPRLDNCITHHLPQQFICLNKKCKDYMIPICPQCPHDHQLITVKKIVPMLSKWISQTWQQIRSQNIDIESQWKICLVNINYCFDILTQVKKMIQNRNVHQLPGFDQILDITTQMIDDKSLDNILKNIQLLDSKYHIWENAKLDSDYVIKEREFRKDKWQKMGNKTKNFSEKALAFSETLAQTIQDKLKYERRIKNLQNLTANKIANLKDLFKQNIEQVSNLKIEFSGNDKSKKQEQQENVNIEKYLEKCENLKTIQINNKNGKIQGKSWDIITTKLEYLKRLRQLKLNIRAEDLKILTKLFSEKPNSVRYIQVLHLTITDEPKLDPKDVAEFCNTLQLRQAHITLCRDNINKNGVKEMLRQMRVHTSMSKLPMKELNLNISKNKIVDQKDILDCEGEFRKKCGQIKKKTMII